jgi:hypothetical protein
MSSRRTLIRPDRQRRGAVNCATTPAIRADASPSTRSHGDSAALPQTVSRDPNGGVAKA